MTKKIDKKWAILAIFWLGLLVYVLLMKLTVSGMPKIQNLDKVGHFGLFFGQFWLIGRAIKGWQIKSYWLAVIVLGLFFAVGSELAQGFFYPISGNGILGRSSRYGWRGGGIMVGAMGKPSSLFKIADFK